MRRAERGGGFARRARGARRALQGIAAAMAVAAGTGGAWAGDPVADTGGGRLFAPSLDAAPAASAPAIEPRLPAAAVRLAQAGARGTDAKASGGESLSKDDLFGTKSDAKAAGEGLSKDDLFGTAGDAKPKPGVRFSGFVDGLGAYTYAQPTHWSRAVGRLQVVAQGELSEAVKWKAGGRVDADLVYLGSDFYLDDVRRDQRASAFWSENYIDFSAGALDFRIGAQQIVWGEVVGLFFADVVSARDTREFLLPSFDIIRIPQWAARAEYFAGDSHVEVVWIPVPAFDRIGKPGSDFYPAPLPSPTSPQVAALFADPDTPSRSLANSNAGIRANTLVAGWDVAAFYYRSYSTAPTFYRVPSATPGQPFTYQPRYDRIWQAGGTVTKDFGDVVLRGEAVYADGLGYSVTGLATPDGVVQRSTLDYILSVEFQPMDDTRVNLQAFQRVFYGGSVDDLVVKSDGFGASLLVSTKLNAAFEPQLLWLQSFKDGGGLVRPRLNWYPAKNTTVGFGVDIFTGSSDGFFGRYNNRDRAYSEVRYDF